MHLKKPNSTLGIILFVAAFSIINFSCKKQQGPPGAKSLVNLVPVTAGSDCGNGGVRIETGVDLNNNSILEASEISNVQSVCNGITGSNGYSSIMRTSGFSANSFCETGGLQIETGIDSNYNGVLDDTEVQQTQEVCNGINGAYDKQIAILLTGNLGASEISPFIYKTPTVNFNIDNFPGVDSAVFFVGNAWVSNLGDTVNFKLYDLTDHTSFDNSSIATGSRKPVQLTSANIFNDLPKKSINLGIQYYVNRYQAYGSAGTSYLVLYRR